MILNYCCTADLQRHVLMFLWFQVRVRLWFWCLNINILLVVFHSWPLSLQFSCVFLLLSSSSTPLPLCSPVTWPRTHLFVTVIWSGWQTTCAPTPSRPAAPAAPAPAGSQTNVLDRSRARNSAAPVGPVAQCRRLQISPSYSLSRVLSVSQTGFVVFIPLVSNLFSFSPLGVAIISALSPLLLHTTFNERSFLAKRFYSAYHLLCRCSSINISPDELGAKERGIVRCFSISPPCYHIVSLVSHSNRSELRSPVEAGIGARVSVRAHHSSALCQSQAPLPPGLHLPSISPCPAHRSPPAGLRFPSHPLTPLHCTSQASTSPLPPPCAHYCVYALCYAVWHCALLRFHTSL